MNMNQSKNSTAHLNSYLGGKPALLLSVSFPIFCPRQFSNVILCSQEWLHAYADTTAIMDEYIENP
jgi:hypothetical protein